MEARDSGSKIRPLPIDDIDGDATQHRPVEAPRRWLPLLVIVAGALAFAVVTRGISPPSSTEVGAATTTVAPGLSTEPDPTTTTEASPPPPKPLSQLLPFAEDGIHLVTIGGSAAVGQWEPESTFPTFNANIGQAVSASYNADGSLVAIHTQVRDGSVVIDSAEGGSPIYLQQDISGGRWHPTVPDLFAWTVFPNGYNDPGDTSYFRVADISGYAGAALEPLNEIPLAGGPHSLLAWGDWGFATVDLSEPLAPVTVYDADGLNPLELEGDFFDATPDGALLMARQDSDSYIPYLLEIDRTETELTGLDIGAADFRITADGVWIVAVTRQADGHTSILARPTTLRSARLTSIDQSATIVDLSSDDRYIILQEVETGELVFKDWKTGAEHRIPSDGPVAAVFL
jgi:hypothetical protein